jgi:mRNA-degrading endonuclease toxin of MazEF toxin-antitoxin module
VAILCRGRIIWATINDPQGRNPKSRPLVVISRDDAIPTATHIRAVAITTRVADSPTEVSVPLPWDRNGHPRTKLNHANVAVCTWSVDIPIEAVEDFSGIVPPKQMFAIDEILFRLSGSKPTEPPS